MPARRLSSRRLLLVLLILTVVSAALAGIRAWQDRPSQLATALAMAPGDASRYSWTDWRGVRTALKADELGPGSTRTEVEDFLDRAYEADLSTASVLDESGAVLQQGFGFSPATLDWEMFSQGVDGAAVIAGISDLDPARIERQLAEVGFTETDGIWSTDMSVLRGVDPEAVSMPMITHVGIAAEEGVVVTSDNPTYLTRVLERVRGDRDGEPAPVPVVRSAAALGEPLAAFVTTGEYACGVMSFSSSSASSEQRAEQLIRQAGDVGPYAGYAIGVLPAGDPRRVRMALTYETEDRARRDAEARATLASGEAPVQGGTFPERFTLGEVAADGEVLTLDLDPVAGEHPFGDLGAGKLLFASC